MKGTGVGPMRRLAAYVVDWYLATMLCGAPLLLVNAMRTGEQTLDTSLPPDAQGWLWGSIAIALGVLYYWLVPLLWHGQTPGKRLTHLRIVTKEGGKPTVGQLLMRQCLKLQKYRYHAAFYICISLVTHQVTHYLMLVSLFWRLASSSATIRSAALAKAASDRWV